MSVRETPHNPKGTVDNGVQAEPQGVTNSRLKSSADGYSLRSSAVRGSIWVLGGFAVSQLIRLGTNVVLAWLLFPEAFGLMVIINVLMQGLTMFSDLGIGPSIIQNKRGREPAFLNTAWTIQVMRGFTIWICACLLTWPIAEFYREVQLIWMVPVASLNAVIAGFGSTSLFTLNRELRFAELTKVDISTSLIGGIVMVGWALLSPTVWAIIAGGLVQVTTKTLASHWQLADNPDRFAWESSATYELFQFGKWIFFSTIVSFLAQNFDRLMLSRLLSLGELGIYSIASQLALVASMTIFRLTDTMLYPILVKKQDDSWQLIEIYLRARRVLLTAAIGLCAAILVGAPLFFELLYDPRYHGAGRLAQWLVLVAWTSALSAGLDRLMMAQGNSKGVFVAMLIRATGIVPATAGYWLVGIEGFIVGISVGIVISVLYVVYALPVRGRSVLLQSLNFTLMFAAFGLIALGGLQLLEPLVPRSVEIVATMWWQQVYPPIGR